MKYYIMSLPSTTCMRRIAEDSKLLENDPVEFMDAVPNSNNMLEWYFIIRDIDSVDSDLKEGEYIGRMIHSNDYPTNPPQYMMMTPNGQVDINTSFCPFSDSKDKWVPTHNIHTIMNITLKYILASSKPTEEKKKQAKESIEYNKKHWKEIYNYFEIRKKKVGSKLLSKINFLYKMPNITITTEEKELYFHKEILCYYSEYFNAMLTHDMKEKTEGKIPLDEKYDDVVTLLDAIHPNKHAPVTFNNVRQLFKMSHKYDFKLLIQDCLGVMINNHIHLDTAKELLEEISYLYNCIETYSEDRDIADKLREIMKRPMEKLGAFYYELTEELLKDLPRGLLTALLLVSNKRIRENWEGKKQAEKFLTGITAFKDSVIKPYEFGIYHQIATSLRPVFTENGLTW